MLAHLLLATLVLGWLPNQNPQPAPLDSRIREVTAYGGSALVTRVAELPPRDGTYLLEGLPGALDPQSVRVRLSGGEVVGTEAHERFQPAVPSQRVQELRDKLRAVQREQEQLQDKRAVLKNLQEYLDQLAKPPAPRVGEATQTSTVAWEGQYAFLQQHLAENFKAARELDWQIEAVVARVKDAQLELGQCQSAGGARLYDLSIDVVARGAQPMPLEVEYLVANAGWEPAYDLRADARLDKVELVYRARLWQQSGEDWKDCDIFLSTAEPQRGAQGPEPQPVWIGIAQPRAALGRARKAQGAEPAAELAMESLSYASASADKDEKSKAPAPAPPPFATPTYEGLSVRYKLARRETIESRREPSTVLVGRAEFPVRAQHVCVPAVDTTVWLRAKAVNKSDWVLLPGAAKVYFGADYIGESRLELIQREQEFTLHLGPDTGFKVERTKVEDKKQGPGFLGSRKSEVRGWRVKLENLGAAGALADGSVAVIVREVLPRSSDDKVQVVLEGAKPPVSEAEEWKKDREEKGFLTWELRIPRSGAAEIEWRYKVSYPDDVEIEQRGGG